jgi:hypothetical protein
MAHKRGALVIAVVAVLGILFVVGWLVNRHLENLNADRQLAMEGHPTPEQLVSLLGNSDKIVLNNALTQLEVSKNDVGRERAVELLHHPDLYVWYCSSLYLGAIGDQRSVPYLIRGLDHPAWRSRPRLLGYLKKLTHEDFGEDKNAWVRWWNSQHPGVSFDFQTSKP